METLIAHRASVEVKAIGGTTPLFWTIDEGRLDALNFLLQHRAQVSATDDEGHTPLHFAAVSLRKEIVEALIVGGANVNARDHENSTPVAANIGFGGGHPLVMLHAIYALTDFDPKVWPDPSPHADYERAQRDVLEMLLAHHADVEARDQRGWTPLHLAAHNHRKDIVKLLLEWHADPNARAKYRGYSGWCSGGTPLHLALITAGEDGTTKEDRNETLRLLLGHHADPNARDEKGQTPLDLPAAMPWRNHDEIEQIFRTEAAAGGKANAQ